MPSQKYISHGLTRMDTRKNRSDVGVVFISVHACQSVAKRFIGYEQ